MTSTSSLFETSGQAVFNPIGIVLAALFVFLMVNLFRWMFKVPPQVPYAVIKARQSVSALHRLLVPAPDNVASERAVELACRLGEVQKAEIVLAYVVEVPYTLSLNTPVPALETKGQEALRTARFIVEQHGLPVKSRIISHRSVWAGILELARQETADAIVMSVNRGLPGLTDGMGRTAQEVVKRAECDVILVKMAARRNGTSQRSRVTEATPVPSGGQP
jgi:nucleotide-binding universal stress UspA family protein